MKNKIKELDFIKINALTLDYVYSYEYAIKSGFITKEYDEELMHALAVIQDKINELIKECKELRKEINNLKK